MCAIGLLVYVYQVHTYMGHVRLLPPYIHSWQAAVRDQAEVLLHYRVHGDLVTCAWSSDLVADSEFVSIGGRRMILVFLNTHLFPMSIQQSAHMLHCLFIRP